MSQSLKIAILGAGNMGTALACVLAGNGHPVVLWDHFAAVVEEIQTERKNSRYLPGMDLPAGIRAVREAEACVAGAALVVIAVPSPFVRGLLQAVQQSVPPEAILLTATKGIDTETQRPVLGTIGKLLPDHPRCILAGPAIANEFSRGAATRVLVASAQTTAARKVAGWLTNEAFQASVTNDTAGAAMGGILKNVYALLFGFAEAAVGSARNFEAALLTAAVAEMADLSESFGATRETLYGLAGLGDLVATAFSKDSHNRKCGRLLGEGRTLSEVETEMGVLPEGARNVKMVCVWAEEKGVTLPLAAKAEAILSGMRPDWKDL